MPGEELSKVSEADGKTPPPAPLAKRARKTVRTLRWWVVMPLPLAVIILNSFGPDGWREPFERLLWVSWACVALALAHAARKALHSYADAKQAFIKSIEEPTGAGLSFLGLCILGSALFLGLISMVKAEPVRAETYVPVNARTLLPMLKDQQTSYWPDFAYPSYFGALIEQESCISLTHSKCWNSKAQLKTDREEGAGLGQFTRAYHRDGSTRFDALAEVKALDPEALREFNWSTVYQRADLSMKAILVKVRDCYRKLERQTKATAYNLMAFCDAAYNGGMGGLSQDRRICASSAGCDANVWFENVEETSNKSKVKWQGYGKSAFEINREHVYNALILRRYKYKTAMGEDLL